MGTGSFPGVKCGRGVLLTTHPLLVPQCRKSRAIPLPTLWATQACNRDYFTFTFYKRESTLRWRSPLHSYHKRESTLRFPLHSYVRITIPKFTSCNLRTVKHNYEEGTSTLVYLSVYILLIAPDEGQHTLQKIYGRRVFKALRSFR